MVHTTVVTGCICTEWVFAMRLGYWVAMFSLQMMEMGSCTHASMHLKLEGGGEGARAG